MQMHDADSPRYPAAYAPSGQARANELPRETQVTAVQDEGERWLRHWEFRRNCSMSPKQVMFFFLTLAVLSLLVAAIAWDVGGSLVMPFTGIELGAVAIALLAYARHATDQERVRLSPQCLEVEWENAGMVQKVRFNPHWVRVSLPDTGLIELSSGGQTVHIGRYTRPERRVHLAKDLRAALRAL